MVTDHDVIYGSARAAERGAFNREAARRWGVKNFFDVGRGGHGHIFPMESGMLLPGMFYFDNDRHSTNAGAIGAFGFRMGSEISRVLATGTNWVMVPKTVRLTIKGTLKPGVHARDVGSASRRCSKTAGSKPTSTTACSNTRATSTSSTSPRARRCARARPKCAPTACSSRLRRRYSRTRAPTRSSRSRPSMRTPTRNTKPISQLDVSALEPQVALPGGVQNAVDVREAPGTRIDHAFLGSCGSGMYEDMQTAAALLKGRRIAPHVRMFVAPGSEESTKRMAREGLLQIFIEAGAVMLPAGCGPCNDAVVGPVHSGEVSISTAANNNFGRFGAKDAQLYLGSPATVAASAIAGQITDPRTLQ